MYNMSLSCFSFTNIKLTCIDMLRYFKWMIFMMFIFCSNIGTMTQNNIVFDIVTHYTNKTELTWNVKQHIQEKICTFKFTYFLYGWYFFSSFSVYTLHYISEYPLVCALVNITAVSCVMKLVLLCVLQLKLESDSFCNSAPLNESLPWTNSKTIHSKVTA